MKSHGSPGAGRADRLVGALASRRGVKRPAENRLARLGNPVDGDDHVHVGTAEDDDFLL